MQPALVVDAPEYMTVEYLKRRVVKAKLQRGDKVCQRHGAQMSGQVQRQMITLTFFAAAEHCALPPSQASRRERRRRRTGTAVN